MSQIPLPIERLAYSAADAGAVTGLSRQTIYNLINAGELRTVKVGRRRLVPRSALLELMGESDAGTPLPVETVADLDKLHRVAAILASARRKQGQ